MIIFGKMCVICSGFFKKRSLEWYSGGVGICSECMREIESEKAMIIAETVNPLKFVFPCTYYTGAVRESFKAYKFRQQKAFERVFTYIAEKRLSERGSLGSFDEVIVLPLSKERMMERGYNQSLFMGKVISGYFGIPMRNEGLRKIKNTKRQSSLSSYERIINIKGAYEADEGAKGKRIIVADDIYTSGATLAEAARTLTAAGAVSVTGIVYTAVPRKKRKIITNYT